jgi:hypothetical protein
VKFRISFFLINIWISSSRKYMPQILYKNSNSKNIFENLHFFSLRTMITQLMPDLNLRIKYICNFIESHQILLLFCSRITFSDLVKSLLSPSSMYTRLLVILVGYLWKKRSSFPFGLPSNRKGPHRENFNPSRLLCCHDAS